MTFIILLFDPEYITAANFRKRRIQTLFASSELHSNFKDELLFLNTILTSPLHRQSKSPTLWHHRWWLLTEVLPRLNIGDSNLQTIVASEFAAVMKAGERHPNNYYAFQHGRR